MEAVLPIEMGVHSLRTVLESEIPEVDWLQSRYDQLCMLDEKILKALYHTQGYQRRLRKAFDKKVRTRDLKLGDLVLKEIRALIQEKTGSSSKIGQILKKSIKNYKDWHLQLPYALWGYRTSIFHRSHFLFIGVWDGSSPSH